MPADIGPIALRAPRWVVEGYATFIEGRVTGSGRPHGAWRAAFLRQWAIEGQLPRYEYLDDWGAYAGGSFAYLAGSAFIEWLAAQHGDSSLVDVWRRLSARQNRTFDEAFTGVYGQSAAALYGRFTAELTMQSLDIARTMAAVTHDTGTIVQRLVAEHRRSRDLGRRPARRDRRSLRHRAVARRHLEDRTRARHVCDGGAIPFCSRAIPRTFPPARSIRRQRPRCSRFAHAAAHRTNRRAFCATDEFCCRGARRGATGRTSTTSISGIRSGSSVRRVTRRASLREPDPAPDGRTAVATHCSGGWCSLVIVKLDDGSVSPLLSASDERSFFRPRFSPDGKTVLVSVHRNGTWRLATVDVEARELTVIDPDDGANRYDAAWTGTERHRRRLGQEWDRQHHHAEPREPRASHALRRDRCRGRAGAESARRQCVVSVAVFTRLRSPPIDTNERDQRSARRRLGATRPRAVRAAHADSTADERRLRTTSVRIYPAPVSLDSAAEPRCRRRERGAGTRQPRRDWPKRSAARRRVRRSWILARRNAEWHVGRLGRRPATATLFDAKQLAE